ncbi:OB-fold domain-containing protein [Niveispirillum sp.]|uniref:Zn-ribbon domain-containing OB-fold protein n=1 Tax=Niveispirillum sp. TaxID=1917217 RepID=UPI001B6D6A52|nr:OB-fold domain-containing protein [Niveispirillum sp.]MBP7337116.1 OB-fold domain-containing protein [Niveispirillum sp.]
MEYEFEKRRITGGIGADDEYWRGLERGEFRLPRCAGCGRWMWPAHFRCGACGSWEMEWHRTVPKGTIYSWTRSWYAFERVKERAGDVPYVTALVEIEGAGGARVMGVLVGDETDLRVGAAVTGEILPPTEKAKGYPSIVWRLADASDAVPSPV